LVAQDPISLYPVDAIVVIGGDHKPERMRQVAKLYREGYAPLVIISAGTLVWEGAEHLPEAQVMWRQAIALGVPAEALLLEQQSGSTWENAQYTKAMLYERRWRSLILVTSPYHSQRARRIFADVMGDAFTLSVQPAITPDFCKLCWWWDSDQRWVVGYEWWNWLLYWIAQINPLRK
jgi:uncharacterized SAM-binding protein YcdF (DUF218 family)